MNSVTVEEGYVSLCAFLSKASGSPRSLISPTQKSLLWDRKEGKGRKKVGAFGV
jgi:hypothetical protein